MILAVKTSLALAGVEPAAVGVRGGSPGEVFRGLLEVARAEGIRAVQLNAAAAGMRPRELDRSARRDVAATLRRLDLECSGLDLWIPAEHFSDPARLDRAAASILGAIDLASDLATLAAGSVVTARPSRPGVVSVMLPADLPGDVRGTIAERAQARGVRIADHAWPARAGEADEPIGVGLDPAAIMAAGEDPVAAAGRLGARVVSARVTDATRTIPPARVAAGSPKGRLDVGAYLVSLAATGYEGHAVIDLRGLTGQAEALRTAAGACAGVV